MTHLLVCIVSGPGSGLRRPGTADMLKDIGVDRLIIGHAEQRSDFGETDETVN